MHNRLGLAASLLLLAGLVVCILGLVAAVVAQSADLGGAATRVLGAVQALPPISPDTAAIGQRALAVAAVAVAVAAAVALPCGLAFATLPAGLAFLGRALLGVPAWALLLTFLLAAALLLGTTPAAQACAEAVRLVGLPVGLVGALALLWLPTLAARVEQAAREVDPVRVRALAGLGVGPLDRLWRVLLPAVAWPLAGAAVVAFLATAALLLGVGEAASYNGLAAPTDLALVAVGLAAVLAPLTAWLFHPR